jgi:hypothetical protein
VLSGNKGRHTDRIFNFFCYGPQAGIKNPSNRLDSYEERIFRGGILLIYVLVASANIITHEMWRDELHVWFTAVESNNLRELFSNMGYQGHPPLWYLMLYAVSRLTRNPAAMQALHLAIAAGSAYIFLRFAPFSRLKRLLFVFGYFPLYEYAAISRNYGIGMFLLFCFCAACGAAKKNLFILSLILFLFSMVNVYTFIITICLLAALGFKAATNPETRAVLIRRKWTILPCTAIVVLGLAASGAVMSPKSDCLWNAKWITTIYPERLVQTAAVVWQGLVPIPQLTLCYWSTNIVPQLSLQAIMGVVLLCFLLLSTANNRTVFVFFSLSVGAMLVFEYVIYMGYLRHAGHFFIVAIVCLWLEKVWGEDKPVKAGFISGLSRLCARGRQWLIVILLVVHFAVGIFASVMEWRYPFSQGKNVARYIREKGLDKLPTVGYQDFAASTVAGYLDRQFYYPNSDTFGTFVVFDDKRKLFMSADEVLESARLLSERTRSDVLLVLILQIGGEEGVVIELEKFAGNLQGDENFYLYLMKYQGQ